MRLTAITICSLILCSCNLRLPVDPLPQTTIQSADHYQFTETVWLHSDGFHTGLIFPYRWLSDSGYIAPSELGSPKSVVVSWGNIDAYSEEGIGSVPNWFEVIFTPTESVIELIGINQPVPRVKPDQELWKAEFPRDRGPHLAHFLNQCCRLGEDGRPIVVRPSSWGKGVQVESRFNYFVPRVCNIWSAQAIESISGPVNLWQATTANSLIRQLKRHHGFELVQKGRSSS
ncbi:MAG: DUF2459 domain-containing protein [Luteolibacter sp.]